MSVTKSKKPRIGIIESDKSLEEIKYFQPLVSFANSFVSHRSSREFFNSYRTGVVYGTGVISGHRKTRSERVSPSKGSNA